MTIAPPAVTAEARAVLHMALGATSAWPQEKEAREEVFSAVVVLGCALGGCRETGAEADPVKADLAATDLIRAMTEHCGPGWGGAA